MGKVIDTLANVGGFAVKGAIIAGVGIPLSALGVDMFDSIGEGLDLGDSFEGFIDGAEGIVDSAADVTASAYNIVGANNLFDEAALNGQGKLTGEAFANFESLGVVDDFITHVPETFGEIVDPDARTALVGGMVGGAILTAESQPVQTVVHKGVHFTGQAARAGANAAGELTKHTGNALSAAGKATSDGVNHLMNKPATHTQGGAGNAELRGMVASNVRSRTQ